MAVQPVVMSAPTDVKNSHRTLFILCLGLFFLWGFATVLIDILIPKLKGVFLLSYAEVMLTQFAFFLGYFIFSLPAAWLVSKLGYMRGIVLGLAVMTGGCLMFAPAASVGVFAGFLAALFIMSGGITILQVAANAVIAQTGAGTSGSSRLTLAQAFNSFGTFLGPFVGARLILGEDVDLPGDIATLSQEQLASLQKAEAAIVQTPFLGIAALLVILAVVFWFNRNLLGRGRVNDAGASSLSFAPLGRQRVLFGVIAIFMYVGAEVSIGSMMANYLMQSDRLGLNALDAGQLVSLYWGGAMVGRFIGAFVLSRFNAGTVLSLCAIGAIALASISAFTTGAVSAYLLLAVGLFNSIMFPTIFALGVQNSTADAPNVSGLLCMGIVGGALLPVLTGLVADNAALSTSLIVPIAAYGWIVFFGQFAARATDVPRLTSTS